MKVKQLIQLLQRHDDDMTVRVFIEDTDANVQAVDDIDGEVVIFGETDEELDM